jgi:hypothetical protein
MATMAWRNIDIDQLMIAGLIARGDDVQDDGLLQPHRGVSDQRMPADDDVSGHPRQVRVSARRAGARRIKKRVVGSVQQHFKSSSHLSAGDQHAE